MTRIIAGSLGGQRLATPKGVSTRPTSERVREALFSAVTSWLGHDGSAVDALSGLAVADFYAGSGAVGLEAISRGADNVFLVESDRATADLIRANAAKLKVRAAVRTGSVEQVVRDQPQRPFDVLWLDPPYAVSSDQVDQVLQNLVSQGWLAKSALVVVERSSRSQPPSWPESITDTWFRRYGETTLYYATNGE